MHALDFCCVDSEASLPLGASSANVRGVRLTSSVDGQSLDGRLWVHAGGLVRVDPPCRDRVHFFPDARFGLSS